MVAKTPMLGRTFGRLTVRSEGPKVYGALGWVCQCACGQTVVAHGGHLRRGVIKSCGCLKREALEYGQKLCTHGMSKTPTYKTWQSMHQRCGNPESDQYPIYGGRGITVCPQWATFEQFLSDMGTRPRGTTIDRIDPDGGYRPGNCKWASAREQANNRRDSVRVECLGVRFTIAEFAALVGLSVPGARHRVKAKFEKHSDGVYRLRVTNA